MAKTNIALDFADDTAAQAFFDEAFQHPRKHYQVQPQDVDVAKQWLSEHAHRRHFGWVDANRAPFKLGDVISMDTLYYRNSCGYANYDVDWGCNGPKTADSEDHYDDPKIFVCRTWSCPIAYEAYLSDLKRKDRSLYQEYRQEPACRDYDESCGDWMILHARPRNAYVANVTIIGCGYNEQEARP